ncbi:hypothetical protein [Desulfoferula mesophila]|uniref:Uncharacterized protein n=1 Tax=Desulfoferula mesophila TaxID=3058419 RepID=A0AAU9EYN4_9BACT|nr:hypothetical protein FAK_09430 [Desulfoferula mesophilus]
MRYKFGNPRTEESPIRVNPRISEMEFRNLADQVRNTKYEDIDTNVLSTAMEMAYYHGWSRKKLINTKVRDVLKDDGTLIDEYQDFLNEHLKYIRSKFADHGDDMPLFPGKNGKKYVERTFNRNLESIQEKITAINSLAMVTFEDLRQAGLCRYYKKALSQYPAEEAFRKTMEHAGIKQRRALRDLLTKGKGQRQGGEKREREDSREWFVRKILRVADGAWLDLSEREIQDNLEKFDKQVDNSQNTEVNSEADYFKKLMRRAVEVGEENRSYWEAIRSNRFYG